MRRQEQIGQLPGEQSPADFKANIIMTENTCCHQNPSHLSELPRINRIAGQVAGVKKMIEENRYCPDILIQIKAIRSALKAVEGNILRTHLQNCVDQSFSSDEERHQKIEELKKLFEKFDD